MSWACGHTQLDAHKDWGSRHWHNCRHSNLKQHSKKKPWLPCQPHNAILVGSSNLRIHSAPRQARDSSWAQQQQVSHSSKHNQEQTGEMGLAEGKQHLILDRHRIGSNGLCLQNQLSIPNLTTIQRANQKLKWVQRINNPWQDQELTQLL